MKKKIDHYFKQHLDVPQEPPLESWDYIQSRLNQKEKRRIFPIWGMISGISALLMLAGGGAYFMNSKPDSADLQNQQNSLNKLNSTTQNPTQSSIQNQSSSVTNANSTVSNAVDNHLHSTDSPNLYPSTQNQNKYVNNSTFVYQPHFNSNFPQPKSDANKLEQHSRLQIFNGQAWKHQFSPNLPEFDDWNFHALFADLNQLESEESPIKITKLEHKKAIQKPKKKLDFNRFYLSGFISPMSLNTFVGGSMLGDDLKDFKTENSITLAYGVKGAYALSKNLKVRTGVSMIGFEQLTKNVPLTTNMSESTQMLFANQNINYSGNVRIFNNSDHSEIGEIGKNSVGNIQQQSHYIEIPVEAELSLIQTQSIGISATAGGSTWLLSKNKIYVSTDEFTQELGKAENLNKTSFSANAGLKFDLKLSDDINLNVEPHFKYLINPVNNIEKYNPYTVGVNAGISINLK